MIKKSNEKQIVIKRSSGRHEKFDIDRMTQTVSRSGLSFLMARDVSKMIQIKLEKTVLVGKIQELRKRQST